MDTIGAYYQHFVSGLLTDYDQGEAQAVAAIAFEHVLGYSRIDLVTKKDLVLKETALKKLNSFLSELKSGRPVQYLTNEVWFQGMKFFVNENVLIPRRETEELVDWIIRDVKKAPESIIDFCTGSGCIAIALKKAFPDARVMGVDISEKAIEVAKRNAHANSLDIEWYNADVFNMEPDLTAELIVSNPPYILHNESHSLASRVKDFEPSLALFVPDTDPLIFYKSISEWALRNASIGGSVYYEINEMMGKEISVLHSQLGYTDYLIKKDLQEKDRFFRLFVPARSL